MVITIRVKSKNLDMFMQLLPGRLARAGQETVKELTESAKDFAKTVGLAPFKSGDLIAGITSSIINKNKGRVVSNVPSTFNYNLWVNNDSRELLLNPKLRDNPKFFSTKQSPFRYGQGGIKSKKGRNIIWTGQPGWFNEAFRLTVISAESVYVGNVKRALQR